jgi:hypothetical protein
MKIYISGGIAKDPNYLSKFAKAEAGLIAQGHEPVNPSISAKGSTYTELLISCLKMQNECDATLFLPDYKESNGAMAEYFHALAIGQTRLFNSFSVSDVLDEVAEFSKVSTKDILGDSRIQEIVEARYIVAYIMRERYCLSNSQIAKTLNKTKAFVPAVVRAIANDPKRYAKYLKYFDL